MTVQQLRKAHSEATRTPTTGPRHEHAWSPAVDVPNFGRCTTCGLLKCLRASSLASFAKLPAFLEGRRFPPTDKQGRYYSEFFVGEHCKVRKSMVTEGMFWLCFDIPGRGWQCSQGFTDLQWDSILTALEHLGDKDPVALYDAAQVAIYGRSWRSWT